MINLLSYLFQRLNEEAQRVYLETAPHQIDNPKYPLVNYKLVTSNEVEKDRQDYIMEIDIWDMDTDNSTVEDLTDRLDKLFYKHRHVDDNQVLIFTRINRLMIDDPDELVRRRQLRYDIKTYEVI